MIQTMKKKEEEKKTSFVRLTRLDGSPIWLNASFVVTVEPRKGGGATVVPIGDGLDYDVRETPETVLACLDGAPVPEVVPVPTSDALTPTPEDVSPEVGYDEAKSPEVPAFVPGPGAPAAGELLDGEAERVRKMGPRTVKKLQNTIKTQFRAANTEKAISALVSRGIIAIDGNKVLWRQPDVDAKSEVAVVPPEEPPAPPAQDEAAPAPEPVPEPVPEPEPAPESEPAPEPPAEPAQEDRPKKAKKPATKAKKGTKKK